MAQSSLSMQKSTVNLGGELLKWAPLFSLAFLVPSIANLSSQEIEGVHSLSRKQAIELLGDAHALQAGQAQSSARGGGEKGSLEFQVREALGKNSGSMIRVEVLARSIRQASERHGFDPRFLLALIRTESGFNPRLVGSVGEIGLMQIRPSTAQWLNEKFRVGYRGRDSLFDPEENIRLGTIYLSYLRARFENNGAHYLAAYNMGVTQLKRSLASGRGINAYPVKVTQHYLQFHGVSQFWKVRKLRGSLLSERTKIRRSA